MTSISVICLFFIAVKNLSGIFGAFESQLVMFHLLNTIENQHFEMALTKYWQKGTDVSNIIL
jgi:hypothetical protein